MFALYLDKDIVLYFNTYKRSKKYKKQFGGTIVVVSKSKINDDQLEMQKIWLEKMSRPGRLASRNKLISNSN